MGLRETLQEALVRANNVRIEQHGIVQDLDGRRIELKVGLQRAQTEKAGTDMANQTVTKKYRELLVLCPINNFTHAGSSDRMWCEVEEDGSAKYRIGDQRS